ncbi:MAG: DUF5989 family protein [Opitutaceae bacterium]|nr:DUF5989 family protein [Opitutaceae bacterium]
MKSDEQKQFEEQAAAADPGIIRSFFAFLKENKKWWMIPILFVLGLLVALVFLGSTGVAPFIYTLF